jgi:hypothetical protein
VEREAIEDAWLDWARYDFVKALEDHLGDEAGAQIDAMTDEQVMELFTTLRKQINAEWVFEPGGKAYINVDQIAAEAEAADLPDAPKGNREEEAPPAEDEPDDVDGASKKAATRIVPKRPRAR